MLDIRGHHMHSRSYKPYLRILKLFAASLVLLFVLWASYTICVNSVPDMRKNYASTIDYSHIESLSYKKLSSYTKQESHGSAFPQVVIGSDGEIVEELDPFLSTVKSTYLSYITHIRHCLESNEANPTLPFTWSDWYGFRLEDLARYDHNDNYQDFKTSDVFQKSEFRRAAKGLDYINSNDFKINQLIFMDPKSEQNYIVGINDQAFGTSSAQFLEKLHDLDPYDITLEQINEELKQIQHLTQTSLTSLSPGKIETRSNTKYNSLDNDELFINLHLDDFIFETTHIDELDLISLTSFNKNLQNFLKNVYLVELQYDTHFDKFFHEVELQDDKTLAGSHYDSRFFKKVLHGKQKYFALHHLIRIWQEFASKEKILYWLSHGNLLSWRWSGTSFLWDHDLDIQLPIRHLEYLAINYNGSLIIEDPNTGFNRYLVEINPYFVDRVNSNKKNSVDGRVIDITTGLYIDLTALSLDELKEDLISDKHIHNYTFGSLTPLRSTFYEGVASWVPHDTDYLLTKEYPEGLSKTEQNGFTYLESLNAWIKDLEHCLESDSLEKGKYYVSNYRSKDCDDLNNDQFEALSQYWNLKKVEDSFVCFNKAPCKPPLRKEYFSTLVPSEYLNTLSNPKKWELSDFATKGLRQLVKEWNKLPSIPRSDMSQIKWY